MFSSVAVLPEVFVLLSRLLTVISHDCWVKMVMFSFGVSVRDSVGKGAESFGILIGEHVDFLFSKGN